MKIFKSITMLVAASLLAACASVGSSDSLKPKTFNDGVAVAYASVTQVRETTTALLQQRLISSEDAQHVQDSANVARIGIDTARKIHAIDPTSATAKLSSVTIGLNALVTYLASKQGVK